MAEQVVSLWVLSILTVLIFAFGVKFSMNVLSFIKEYFGIGVGNALTINMDFRKRIDISYSIVFLFRNMMSLHLFMAFLKFYGLFSMQKLKALLGLFLVTDCFMLLWIVSVGKISLFFLLEKIEMQLRYSCW